MSRRTHPPKVAFNRRCTHPAQEIGTMPIFSSEKATIRRKFRQGCKRALFESSGFEPTFPPSAEWADDCMEVAADHA
jgi:hypothetical protein